MSWPVKTPMPPGTRADQTIAVAVSRHDLEDLDRLRGDRSRSSFMRQLLKDAIAASAAAKEDK